MNRELKWFSPAKINFYLAVLGKRQDGFHRIESIVSKLDFGDDLCVLPNTIGSDRFSCNTDAIGWSSENLVYRALDLYRSKTGLGATFDIALTKRIPLGSGLGGGSSNASTMLKALDALSDSPVGEAALQSWSADIGSDCPLFFSDGFAKISGRGEIVEPFPCVFHHEQANWKCLLFHPGFGVSAAWAYQTLQKDPTNYTQVSVAQEEIREWRESVRPWIRFHRNDLSLPIDHKFLPIKTLKDLYFEEFGFPLYMSGSGSTCFSILPAELDTQLHVQFVQKLWGEQVFYQECRLTR